MSRKRPSQPITTSTERERIVMNRLVTHLHFLWKWDNVKTDVAHLTLALSLLLLSIAMHNEFYAPRNIPADIWISSATGSSIILQNDEFTPKIGSAKISADLFTQAFGDKVGVAYVDLKNAKITWATMYNGVTFCTEPKTIVPGMLMPLKEVHVTSLQRGEHKAHITVTKNFSVTHFLVGSIVAGGAMWVLFYSFVWLVYFLCSIPLSWARWLRLQKHASAYVS